MQLRDSLQRALGGAYRLGRELGGGGMSRVFVAEDLALARPVAIKVVSVELERGAGIERFTRETAMLARLQHPHIVPILSAGDADGVPFIIMPFVNGESLRALLTREGPLSLRYAVGVLDNVAKALAFAHRHGIVHRDIKPENILLSGGAAVVTDFGIAKALESSRLDWDPHRVDPPPPQMLTTSGFALGTPAYMAPEQVVADPSMDARADLYALGVVTYEMLIGRRPFGDRTGRELLAAHLSEVPPLVSDLRPDVPLALATLVESLLAKNPSDRPDSADTVIARLGTIATPTPGPIEVEEERSARGAQQVRRDRRSRRRLGIAAIALLTIVIGAAVALRRSRLHAAAPVDPQLVAVVPFRVGGADPSLRYLREGMLDLLAAKMPGTGGARATEPRTLLSAWRRAGGSPDVDLPESEVRQVAERLGSRRVLLGSIVGTSAQVVVDASLVLTSDGRRLAESTVSGPADSLMPLVDRLTAQLLTLGAGEGDQRLRSLTSTSLPALRAYLDGRAAAREARFRAAYTAFGRALALDSTFALAGLALQSVAGWIGQDSLTRRGAAIAWAQRARLSPRDRSLLDVVLGPRYPLPSPARDMRTATDRYLALAPDAPDAWFRAGDLFYHYGGVLGVADASDRARRDFIHAIALDSSYVEPMLHLYQLAAQVGDRELAQRVDRLWTGIDSSATRLVADRWYAALAAGDSETVRGYRSRIEHDALDPEALGDIEAIGREVGVDMPDVHRALLSKIRRHAETAFAGAPLGRELAIQYDLGHATEASRMAHLMYGPTSETSVTLDVLSWPYGDGDSLISARALPALARMTRAPRPADDPQGRNRQLSILALAAAHFARNDRPALTLDRQLLASTVLGDSTDIGLLVADAMVAMSGTPTGTPPRTVDQLDSALRAEPAENPRATTYALGNIVLAQYLAAHGQLGDALAHIRSRGTWDSTRFLASMLRWEGDIAYRAGDRSGALRAYTHYLALRYDPDSSLRPERDSVTRALRTLDQH